MNLVAMAPDGGDDVSLKPPTTLSQDLLPYLFSESGVKLVGQAILAAAATKQASRDRTTCIDATLFPWRPFARSEDDADDDDDDNILCQNCSILQHFIYRQEHSGELVVSC